MKTNREIAKGEPPNLSRRTLLKSLTAAAAAAVLPSGMERLAALVQSVPAQKGPPSPSPVRAKNPAWYGFNLLEYFSTDPDWMKYFPYKDDGLFLEDDFRWIRDSGDSTGSVCPWTTASGLAQTPRHRCATQGLQRLSKFTSNSFLSRSAA